MARSTSQDICDKFRFRVIVVSLEINRSISALEAGPLSPAGSFDITAGFSEVILPKVNIKERLYRENIDPNRYIKSAGLATYEPVILRRGKVNNNKELYEWYTEVNNDAASISPLNSILSNQNFVHIQTPDYKREVFIELLDRAGQTKRAWLLVNAWPSTYKGGNDLNATSEEKLIEEMTLSYESFLELKEATVEEINAASQEAARRQAIAGAIAILAG